jgi:prefoldin alpha subunit
VVVDVGTGFYVEKVRIPGSVHIQKITPSQSTKDATKFYEEKVEELGANLKDLETIVQGKSNNLRVVEDGKSHSELPYEGFADFCLF